jgi:hypothetical protein
LLTFTHLLAMKIAKTLVTITRFTLPIKLGLKSTTDPFPEDAIPKLTQAVSEFESGKWKNEPDEEEAQGCRG